MYGHSQEMHEKRKDARPVGQAKQKLRRGKAQLIESSENRKRKREELQGG